LSQLYSRTGLEFLLVACRSTAGDFVKPFAYFSSDTIKGFFNSSLNRSVDDFALQMEAYVMSGIKGAIRLCNWQALVNNNPDPSFQVSSKTPRHRLWSSRKRQLL
jgi:hypothetical protein